MSCCIYVDDYDTPAFCRVTEVGHARSDYVCSECRKTINKGESYRRIVGKWDRFIDTYKHCERCAGIWDALEDVDCPMYGGLWDIYEEWLGNAMPPFMETHWERTPAGGWVSRPTRE